MFAHSRRKKRKKSRKFEWKLRGVDRRSVEVKTCLTVRRETANGRSDPTSSTRHSVPVSHAASLIGVPCKLVACVREFRWYIRTYARSKSEKERQREGERRETRKEGADSAHDTHVYTRQTNSNDGHVYSMRTVHFVHVHTLYTLARLHVPHIDSVAARTLLHARARMEYEREREESNPDRMRRRKEAPVCATADIFFSE